MQNHFLIQRKKTAALGLACLGLLSLVSQANGQMGRWQYLPDTAKVLPREECGFAQVGGKFYLLGGRSAVSVQEYDPILKSWKDLKKTPDTLNHFQAVSHAGLVYIIGAFNQGPGYPNEAPAPVVHIYDPLSDTWVKGMTIPLARRRGSAGVVESGGKFYVVLGNKLGHTANGVKFLDEFDPTTNAWTPLADGPRSRDHFQAAAANGKIYAVGGRMSGATPSIFTTLEKSDVYDIAAGTWSTLPATGDLVTPRSGGIAVTLGNDIIYAGGSNADALKTNAYDSTKALNVTTHTWRSLASMNRGRQVTGGFIYNSGLYVVSGSGGTGGGPTLKSMEVFFMNEPQLPIAEALDAGKLVPAESDFNMGIVPAGQTATRTFQLKHATGNQGVLISGLKVTGDAAFQLKTTITAPYLVRPGAMSAVEIAYASTGAASQPATLEVTLAVPPGTTLKVPLDANRKAVALAERHVRARGKAKAATAGYYRNRNALGKQAPIAAPAK